MKSLISYLAVIIVVIACLWIIKLDDYQAVEFTYYESHIELHKHHIGDVLVISDIGKYKLESSGYQVVLPDRLEVHSVFLAVGKKRALLLFIDPIINRLQLS